MVPWWASHSGGDELRSELGCFALVDRLQRLGHRELCAKALLRPRSTPAMSMSLDVAPLVGGIVEELLHLSHCLEPQTLQVKT
jgi:hypothetical protein